MNQNLDAKVEALIKEYSLTKVMGAFARVVAKLEDVLEERANASMRCAIEVTVPLLAEAMPRMKKDQKAFTMQVLNAPVIQDALNEMRRVNSSGSLHPMLEDTITKHNLGSKNKQS